MLQVIAVAILLAMAAPAAVSGQSPDLAAIVAHMSRVERQAMDDQRAYELTRKYQIFEKDNTVPHTEVLAHIEFTPPGEKSYAIEQSTGGMGERAIRHALDREVDLTRNPDRAAMTERNYSFTLAGEADLDGHHCWVLGSHPKRDDKDLLKADLWVDQDSYRILRIVGSPQKTPSFWVKDIRRHHGIRRDQRHVDAYGHARGSRYPLYRPVHGGLARSFAQRGTGAGQGATSASREHPRAGWRGDSVD